MLTMAEMLADDPDRFEVHALGTSASENPSPLSLAEYFSQQGILPNESIFSGRKIYRYTHRGVRTTVLDVGCAAPLEGEKLHGGALDSIYEQTLRKNKIEAVLTFGGHPEALRRRRIAKQHNCRVIFGLRNWGYLVPNAFVDCDAIITATQFVTDRYRRKFGVESTPIPLAVEPEDVLASTHDRIFVTTINPSPEKGLVFLIRLLDELATRRPDIPALIIESRGGAGQLLAAAKHFDIDLAHHESIMLSRGVAKPRDMFAVTRLLLVPSVWDEPAGRVAVEAMINGIPPLVSDCGGLPETVGSGGIVLPMPSQIKTESTTLPPTEDVGPWLKKIIDLTDDAALYERQCELAKIAAAHFHPSAIKPRLHAFFDKVLAKGHA